MSHTIVAFTIFLFISVVSILISGAPLRVHAVNILALFIAFIVPSLAAVKFNKINKYVIWLCGAMLGIIVFDIGSSYVISKRELFMGWYILYPVGLIVLLLLQFITNYASTKLPYNKSSMDAPVNRQ